MNKDAEIGAVVVVNSEQEVCGIITRADIINERIVNVTMVGCQQADDTCPGVRAEGVFVDRVIDIHYASGNESKYPIDITVRQFGAISTIVSLLFRENGIVPPVSIAGLLLSGIIANTKLLKAMTTTATDVLQAKYLALICGIDIEEYGKELFS